MTDHALHRTTSISLTGFAESVSRLVRNWCARRAVARLAEFDDYMLRDIGVTRLDVRWAAGLPLTVNAALALEERSQRRRAGFHRD